MSTGTLDTNEIGDVGALLALTTETVVSLYVEPATGSHDNHRVTLEFSPDNGVTWIAVSDSVNGTANSITVNIVATDVRACVCEVEGKPSTINVHILAR